VKDQESKSIYITIYRQCSAAFCSESNTDWIGDTDWKIGNSKGIKVNTTVPKAILKPVTTPLIGLPSMETINETEESTTTTITSTEELKQLIQHLQEELIVEDKRYFETVAYFKDRIQEVQEEHIKKQRFLETKLLQAITTVEHSVADGDYWLNNTKIQKKEPPKKKLTKEEKTLIRSRVKEAYAASKKK